MSERSSFEATSADEVSPRAESSRTPSDGSGPSGAQALARKADALQRIEAYRRGELAREDLALRGARLIEADLRGLDLCQLDLSGADLSRARLDGVRALGVDLSNATLVGASLVGAELAVADLSGADLRDADLTQSGLGRANLRDADASGAVLRGASCVEVDARGCRFGAADLVEARLVGARLSGADLCSAKLGDAELAGATVDGASFRNASLVRASVRGLQRFRDANWLGTDIRDVDPAGTALWRSFVLDQNHLDEFRRQSRRHEWVYRVWWLTSDCGRSALRWMLCSLVFIIGFAGLYTSVDVDFGDYETPLSPLYFSVVTFTTLGYGDVLPRSIAAQSAVIAEVIVGYIMLGGLLSLISAKLSQRSAP